MQRVPDKLEATGKATLRALKLLCVGLVLQGIKMATIVLELNDVTVDADSFSCFCGIQVDFFMVFVA
jgi:hypothetical protein